MRLNPSFKSVLSTMLVLMPKTTASLLTGVLICLSVLSAGAGAAQDKPIASTNLNTNPNAAAPPASTLINVPDQPDPKPSEKNTPKKLAAPGGKSAENSADKSAIPSSVSTTSTPAPAAAHIALILPLNSKVFGNVAEAIKQGFIAAATVDGKDATPYRIYPRDDEAASLGSQYRKAVQEGAIAVIGGVTRDGTNLMVKEAGYLPTLALNAPTETDLPDRFFYVSLSLDAEARNVAREAAQSGFRNAAMLSTNTTLTKRIQDSFEKEWIRLGGAVVDRITFTGDIAESNRLQKALDKTKEKSQADVVFIAADAKAARMARPFVPVGMPVFATSHTLDARAGAVENLDLDSVRFLEMPWFVEKDHPAVMAYAKPHAPLSVDTERLYALGIDAWRLMQVILKADKPKNIASLDGVTGKLTLDGAQFIRTLTAVEMRDGLPQLFRPSDSVLGKPSE